MRKLFFSLIILSLFTVSLLGIFPSQIKNVLADDPNQQLQEKQSEIDQLTAQLNETRKQENTLKSQLDIIDGQTKITNLKIEATKLQIEKLQREINDLSGRIDRLSGSVDQISQILLNRIVQTYKYSNVDTLDMLFASHGLSDMIERLKYIQVAQANDKKMLYQLQATKAAYHDQKQDKETRQDEAEKLNKQLQDYQQQLDQQKQAKAQLLKITQNNEAVYQQKLQTAIAEQQAILAIFAGGGNEVSDGPVHKGDAIGHFINGASACSSGSHLHFEIHQNNALQNPAGLLANHNVIWDNSPDGQFGFSGSWDLWPIDDPVYIEQGFGNTWWAQHGWYTNPPGHTGIDMWTPNSNEVKSVHDGQLSHGGIACGKGTLMYKKVDHGDGFSSYYLHVL